MVTVGEALALDHRYLSPEDSVAKVHVLYYDLFDPDPHTQIDSGH